MFGFQKTFSGIDIGAGTIRAVRIRRGKTLVLDGYAEKKLPEGVLVPSYTKENILELGRFLDILRPALDAAGIARGDISLSIPDRVIKVSFIELKGVPGKREEVLRFVKWKSKRSLPYDPEAAKIDYQILGDTAMTVFVKEDVVSNYEEALLSVGLRPRHVSAPSLSLFNLFSARFREMKDFAFISVLEDSFAVVIVKGGILDFHRSKDIGFTDERVMREINSSILFYLSERQGMSLDKGFLYAGIRESEPLAVHLSESCGMEIETLRLSGMIEGPKGMDIEPYGPAAAAALYKM